MIKQLSKPVRHAQPAPMLASAKIVLYIYLYKYIYIYGSVCICVHIFASSTALVLKLWRVCFSKRIDTMDSHPISALHTA